MIGPGSPMPIVVKVLLLANVGVFALQWLFSLGSSGLDELLVVWGGLLPSRTFGEGEIWRVVTYMFLHGGVVHLAFNMLSLWMFGSPLGWALGNGGFLRLYFVGGIVAGACSVVFYPMATGTNTMIIGASGALFAVMLGFARRFPDQTILVFLLFPLPARWAVAVFGGLSLFLSMGSSGGVAHATHLFGLLGGWLAMRGLEQGRPGPWTRLISWQDRRRAQKAAEDLVTREEYFDTRVDPILRKISRHGIDSLTRQERQVLDRARDLQRPGDRPPNVVDFPESRNR